jgi:hypothetical protein
MSDQTCNCGCSTPATKPAVEEACACGCECCDTAPEGDKAPASA